MDVVALFAHASAPTLASTPNTRAWNVPAVMEPLSENPLCLPRQEDLVAGSIC